MSPSCYKGGSSVARHDIVVFERPHTIETTADMIIVINWNVKQQIKRINILFRQ